jgi:hypothetical protein
VFHRITGVALYAGTFLVAVWLVALASGPGAYDPVAWLYGSMAMAMRVPGSMPWPKSQTRWRMPPSMWCSRIQV